MNVTHLDLSLDYRHDYTVYTMSEQCNIEMPVINFEQKHKQKNE